MKMTIKLHKTGVTLSVLWAVLGIAASILLLRQPQPSAADTVARLLPAAAGTLLSAETHVLFKALAALAEGNIAMPLPYRDPDAGPRCAEETFGTYPVREPEPGRCPVCGCAVTPEDRTCPDCGTPI